MIHLILKNQVEPGKGVYDRNEKIYKMTFNKKQKIEKYLY